MTELALLLAIHSSGLLFAVVLTRLVAPSDAPGAELHRLGSALMRAADAFLAQELRLVALVAGILASVCFALYSALLQPGSGLGGLETGFWAALGVALGATSTCLVARGALRLGVRASLGTLAAAERSMDRALGASIRAGGAIGLFVETVSVLSMALVFGLLFAMKGGMRLDAPKAAELAMSVAFILPAYALGVAAAALVLQRAGSTYHAAADVGADLAGERDAGLEHDDPRNPAIVSDLVGDQVGLTTGRAVDLYLSATVASVCAVVLGASLHEPARALGLSGLALAALPMIARSFGVIASAFGVMVVRTEDPESPLLPLWRGQLATAVISAGGIAGSALWLVGEPHWLRLFWAGVLGLGAAALSGHVARLRVDRKRESVKDLVETLRVAEAPGLTLGVGFGLEAAIVPILTAIVAIGGAWQLGASTGLPSGGLYGTLMALMMMLASAPYVLALATLGPVADGARGVAAMAAATSSEAERRTARLDEAAFAASSVSQTYLIVTSSVAALLAASAVSVLGARGAAQISALDLGKPAVVFSAALALALILAFAGNSARSATRGARGVAQEVERQLRGFPRDKGRPTIPQDFTPSYRACVELCARAGLSRLGWPVVVGLAPPLVLGLVLLAIYRKIDGKLPVEALVGFVAIAALGGLAAALAVDGMRATLSAARRATRRGTPGGGLGAALGVDAVADVLGNAAGPAAQLMVKTVAVVALALAPFLRT